MEKSKEPISFNIEARIFNNSEKEMPKKHGRKSLRPYVEAIFGINREGSAITTQNNELQSISFSQAQHKIIRAALNKITPRHRKISMKLDIDEDDLKPLKKMSNYSEYVIAQKFLKEMQKNKSRSAIFYNLGVFLEAQEKFKLACQNYQKAYELSNDSSYLENKLSCEKRRDFQSKYIGIIKNKISTKQMNI